MNGGACVDDADVCDRVLYVHTNVPGSACPEQITYPEVYVNANPTGSENLVQEQAERRVIELRNESVRIVQEIQQLELAKARLVEETREVLSVQIGEVRLQDLNQGLEQGVNQLARKEIDIIQEIKEAQEDIAGTEEVTGDKSLQSIEVIEAQGNLV